MKIYTCCRAREGWRERERERERESDPGLDLMTDIFAIVQSHWYSVTSDLGRGTAFYPLG